MQDRKMNERKEKLEFLLNIRHSIEYVFWIYVIYTVFLVHIHTHTYTNTDTRNNIV